jgi:hypothetical protein
MRPDGIIEFVLIYLILPHNGPGLDSHSNGNKY